MVDFLRKRLQVFVSSTFSDLISERQAAVEAILTAGHIPAGMELFTSGDESQMEVIKQWIDESDVYLLILGGRYGSVEPTSNKSYTQLEYEYAIEKSKPVFACAINEEALEKRIKKFGSSMLETDNPSQLKEFRKLVLTKMVRFWDDIKDIKISIGETLSHFARREDLVGWIRPHQEANMPALADEITRLSKENNSLKTHLNKIEQKPEDLVKGLAGLDERFTINGTYIDGNRTKREWSSSLTWKEIFSQIAPYLLKFPNDKAVKDLFIKTFKEIVIVQGTYFDLNDQDFQTIKIQLKALRLTDTDYSKTVGGSMDLFWSLTTQGENLMMQLRTVPIDSLRTKTLAGIFSRAKR